jgi:hypothetical protein
VGTTPDRGPPRRARARRGLRRPEPLTDEEIAWCRRAGADLRAVFDAFATSHRERKRLLRAIITEVVVTVDRAHHRAAIRVVLDGGAITDHSVGLPRTGSHTRATDQNTIALVRRLAEHHPDAQIAAILARQGRLTGHGNPFTAARVHALRPRRGPQNAPEMRRPGARSAETTQSTPGRGDGAAPLTGVNSQPALGGSTLNRP